MMQFLCIKWGNKYSPEYVNNLYGMIKRNYNMSFKLTCFTDDPEGIDPAVNVMPIPDVDPLHPKHWFGRERYCWDRSKILIYNSHKWLKTEGPFCYFDLDIIIQNRIDDFYKMAFQPHMIYSHWQEKGQEKHRQFTTMRGTYHNSSCVMWWGDQCEKIYEDFLTHQNTVFKTFYKGTDNYYPWREFMVVGDSFWNFLPKQWVYSYNREGQVYKALPKLCLFNADLVQQKTNHKKLEDIEDTEILIHWKGKDQFEKLWLPKLPEDFFSYNKKDIDRLERFLSEKNYQSIEEKFLQDFPRFSRDSKQRLKTFELLSEWVNFNCFEDEEIVNNHIDLTVLENIKTLYGNQDYSSLINTLLSDFPRVNEFLRKNKNLKAIKAFLPELTPLTNETIISNIPKESYTLVEEYFKQTDLKSIHKKFLADFPNDDKIQRGDEKLYWNRKLKTVLAFYEDRFILKEEQVVAEEAKKDGIERYFWNCSLDDYLNLYKRLFVEDTKKVILDQVKKHGIQRVFWEASFDDVRNLYEACYIQNIKDLFYKEDYEEVFNKLYNIMPKDKLLEILNQKEGDNESLINFFHAHSENYSDIYHGLYEDPPEGAIIQLSTKINDTGNDFDDIFVTDDELSLVDIKRMFDDVHLNWVIFSAETTDPRNAKDFDKIYKYFEDRGCNITVKDVEPHVKSKEEKEVDIIVSDNRAVTLETVKSFKQSPETRKAVPKRKERDPVWCSARKDNYFYVSATKNVYPCFYIARDVTENRLYPYHPIDYEYNMRYNSLNNFSVGEIIYNKDFSNVSEHLKRNPLSICKKSCGKCE